MSKVTMNSTWDATLRTLEDLVVVAGPALAAWKTGQSPEAVFAVAAGSPLIRSGVAKLLSGGRVSGILLAVKLVLQALTKLDEDLVTATASADPLSTVNVSAIKGDGGSITKAIQSEIAKVNASFATASPLTAEMISTGPVTVGELNHPPTIADGDNTPLTFDPDTFGDPAPAGPQPTAAAETEAPAAAVTPAVSA